MIRTTNDRQRRKRLLTALMAGMTALVVTLTACGGGTGGRPAQEGEARELTLFLIPSPTAEAIKKLIPAYEKSSGIKVTIVDAPYDDAHQKQLLSFRSRRGAYDIVQFDNPFLAVYGDHKVLAPLDTRVKGSAEYDIGDFVQPLQDYGKYEGVTYGLVLSTEPFLLWYRKDIYKKLDLSVPTTWDEYYANAKAIQDGGQAAGQIIANSNPTNSWWWLQFLWSFGGDLTDAQGTPTVNTPSARQATEYMKKLLSVSPKSAVSAGVDEATSLFISQDIGQMINYSGFYPTITDPAQSKFADLIGYAPIPRASTEIVQLTGWNIGIPADSRKQDAAWKFLEFLLGKSGTKQLIRAGGAAIGRNSVGADPDLTGRDPYLKLLAPAAQSGRRLPALVQWPEVSNQIGVRVADVLTGKETTDTSLRDLQNDLKSTLGR